MTTSVDKVISSVGYTLNPAAYAKSSKVYKDSDLTVDDELPEFDLTSVHSSVVLAHSTTKEWVKYILNKDMPPHWLTLTGVPGCGKTMLGKRARNLLRKEGRDVQLWNWTKVLRRCLNEGEWELIDHLIKIDILILDDVGAEFSGSRKASDINTARLYDIAEGRLGKWTLITTNLTIEQTQATIGPRFTSRLFRDGSVIVDMHKAADYCYRQWLANNTSTQQH